MNKRITTVLSTLAGVVAIVAYIAPWPTIWGVAGWQTPNQHSVDIEAIKVDHELVNQEILDALKNLGEKQDANFDAWKCDEWDEELAELRVSLLHAETAEERARIEHEIEKLKLAMESRRCARFEDFG